jgi:hypothetical protein
MNGAHLNAIVIFDEPSAYTSSHSKSASPLRIYCYRLEDLLLGTMQSDLELNRRVKLAI